MDENIIILIKKLINFVKTLKSVEHISEESFLRQVCKEKKQIIKLVQSMNYRSDELSYLLSCIGDRKENSTIQFDPRDGDEDEVNYFHLIKIFKYF